MKSLPRQKQSGLGKNYPASRKQVINKVVKLPGIETNMFWFLQMKAEPGKNCLSDHALPAGNMRETAPRPNVMFLSSKEELYSGAEGLHSDDMCRITGARSI